MIRNIEFIAKLNDTEKSNRREYPYEDFDRPKMPTEAFWQFRDKEGRIERKSLILFPVEENAQEMKLVMPHMRPLIDAISQGIPFIGLYFCRMESGLWTVQWHVHTSICRQVSVPPLSAPGVFKGQREAYRILPATSLGLDIAVDPLELEYGPTMCKHHLQGKVSELCHALKEYSPRAALAINLFDPVPIILEIQRLKLL